MNATAERLLGVEPDVMERLVAANRPAPFDLLQRTADILSQSFAVTDLLVRGSLAANRDRLSDVDFVVGVDEPHFGDFVSALDALVTSGLGAILPGWRDTIVTDMGGLGYVYLVTHHGRLHQLDLYVAPSGAVSRIVSSTGARELLRRNHTEAAWNGSPHLESAAPGVVISRERGRAATCTELLVEVLVLGQLIKKRLARGQDLIAYGENHLLTVAFRELIKAALAPASEFEGWYHLPEEVAATPIGRECLAELSAVVAAPAIPTTQTLADALRRVVTVAGRAAPQSVEQLRPAIDAYTHYLELP